MIKWMMLFLVILLTVVANILLKSAAEAVSALSEGGGGVQSLIRTAMQWRVITAIGCFGIAFIAYSQVLQRFDLSVAYPIIASATLAMVAVSASIWLDEPFPLLKFIGTGLILVGVILLTQTV